MNLSIWALSCLLRSALSISTRSMQASDSSSLPHKLQASTSSTIGPSLVSASNATANTPPFSSALSALSTLAETSISSAAPVLEQDAEGRQGHGVSDDSNGERVSKASKRRKKELSMRKACERCRERKNACDGNCPCSMCVKSFQDMQAAGSPCLFSSAAEMCVRNTRKSIFQARTDRKETDVSDLPPHSASSPTHEGTWFAAWRSSPQGPFPVGNNHLQPSLSLALPDNTARNQSFRMNLHLSLPSSPPSHLRFLFSNLYGRSPLRLTHLSLARHAASAHVHPATQLDLTFGGHNAVVLAAGCEHASDAIALPPWLSACGGRVSVTFAVNGTCEGVTWHTKAMATNYMSSSGSGAPPLTSTPHLRIKLAIEQVHPLRRRATFFSNTPALHGFSCAGLTPAARQRAMFWLFSATPSQTVQTRL